jgi:glucosylceramidase
MKDDDNMTYFDLQHDVELMLPMINAALGVSQSSLSRGKLFGSPWSPPAWMKTNNNMLNGGSLRDDKQLAWANYISQWISSYNSALNFSMYSPLDADFTLFLTLLG